MELRDYLCKNMAASGQEDSLKLQKDASVEGEYYDVGIESIFLF